MRALSGYEKASESEHKDIVLARAPPSASKLGHRRRILRNLSKDFSARHIKAIQKKKT